MDTDQKTAQQQPPAKADKPEVVDLATLKDLGVTELTRISALTSVDLPTLDRPTRANSARPSAGHPSGPAALVTNVARTFKPI